MIRNTLKHNNDYTADKLRERLFAKYCAELVRESSNHTSFEQTKIRILSSREATSDQLLHSMLTNFIAERQSALQAHAWAEHKSAAPTSTRRSTPEEQHSQYVSPKSIAQRLAQLEQQFHDLALHFYETEANQVCDRIGALLRESTDDAAKERLSHYREMLGSMHRRRREFDRHVELVADKAIAALKAGDLESTKRALNRLSSIHAFYPHLLSLDHFTELRERIIHASDEYEHRAAARRLVELERAVAAELKNLAKKLHHFHKLALTLPHDKESYREAEKDYHQVVNEVKAHDKEWLAGIILEFVELLSEIHDPPPKKAARQVDHFVASLRTAVEKLERRACESNS